MKKSVLVITVLLLGGLGYYFWSNQKPRTPPTTARVESYFEESMGMSPEEARNAAASGVDLRVSKNATLEGIVGNLYYYGFIDDQNAFTKLLTSGQDSTPGREGAIAAGNNSIDIESNYYLNYAMSEEEIADTLLSRGRFDENFNRYSYLFMPSAPGSEVPSETMLEGEYVCLPPRDQSVPSTLECAFGIRTEGGYYGLSTAAIAPSVMQTLPIGERIRVSGVVIPIEQASTNIWKKYDIEGIVEVASLEKL